ncbi:L-rhamnose isomerase [Spirochaeta thermophila DSM 6578]|uniref:L-rhamnose isomerase n=1 Tax=Winmispira thermophila (strain ATCC 700085 / DSM 6578 / Z-1203) TaxID=869211 RepID=G0GFI3_WINT7|nr:L-rhamnose isomerase [Spirochaeta thermophila]AEJ61597.1 L-rhamnose isomerase [Spirochaeta thermophila DSM 6578]
MTSNDRVERAFEEAKARYADLGVDVEAAVKRCAEIPVSIHCWQGDDVVGLEGKDTLSGGGILATGNYPGRARSGDELRQDAAKAFSLVPGTKRFNLHAMYAETEGKRVDRDALEPRHFEKWVEWAKSLGIGLDFNPTFFSHPLADSGFTLSHPDEGVRAFWVRHAIACERIAAYFASELDGVCINNLWIPDGWKDIPVDRLGPRERLLASLDEIYRERLPGVIDTVESKLFGIGSESYVTGSHEFYLGYAVSRNVGVCLDMGHFHPTETIHDKISSLVLFVPHVLIHMSRGVRWDSDHVVLFTDDVRAVAAEMVRLGRWEKIHLAVDYFDASINRILAWVIGARAVQKALLSAFLEPVGRLEELEAEGRLGERLALMEDVKSLPFAAVWDYYCLSQDVPLDVEWIREVEAYERQVLSKRT